MAVTIYLEVILRLKQQAKKLCTKSNVTEWYQHNRSSFKWRNVNTCQIKLSNCSCYCGIKNKSLPLKSILFVSKFFNLYIPAKLGTQFITIPVSKELYCKYSPILKHDTRGNLPKDFNIHTLSCLNKSKCFCCCVEWSFVLN